MDLVEYMLISSALSTNKSSAVAEMGDCLAAIDIGQKVGRGCASFCGGGSGVPIQHNVAWAKAYRRTKWYPNASSHLATIHIGRKVGATVPLLEGGNGSPSNTMWLGPRHTAVPSGILIHPAVWLQ